MRSFSFLPPLAAGALACSSAASPASILPDAGSPTVPATAPEPAAEPPVEWSTCDTTSWPDGYPKPTVATECAVVNAPLDHAAPGAGTFPLRIARQRAKNPSGRVVFQIAGGPGGASVWQAGIIPRTLAALRDDFDFVYVDQRGTGGSGYLDCKDGYPDTEEQWIACASDVAGKPLQHSLTLDAAHDLDFVRRRLGYDKIYVRAGSYGTRVGLELIRRHPTSLAAAVLDGVDPPDVDFLGELARRIDVGLSWLVRDCAADAACVSVSPHLDADLASYRAALKGAPRPISVGGKSEVEDEALFVDALEACLDDPTLRFRVPRAVHDAVTGDTKGWDAILSELLGAPVAPGTKSDPAPRRRTLPTRGPSYVAPGLWMTVTCAEDFPKSGGADALQAVLAKTAWPETRPLAYAHACARWPVVAVPPAQHAPVTSDVKVLLLSGGVDLRTPPEWAEHAKMTLSNGTHIVVQNAFHSVMSTACGGALIASYLKADGDPSRIDRTCLDHLPKPTW
jgi:pimeloyl-ACP methyl ester carboxylesterase